VQPGAYDDLPTRRHPAKGVHVQPLGATIVFVTVCTKNRDRWLADPAVHDLLIDVWRGATAWVVGRYVLMPDHLHLFCSPGSPALPLVNWIRFWKSRFSTLHGNPGHVWHVDAWDRRLRSGESYREKWDYVRNNPVRKGLVKTAEEWPYQGELNDLEW
jgi:putative transposase